MRRMRRKAEGTEIGDAVNKWLHHPNKWLHHPWWSHLFTFGHLGSTVSWQGAPSWAGRLCCERSLGRSLEHVADRKRGERSGRHAAPARGGFGVVAGCASTEERLFRGGFGAARRGAGCLAERASRRGGRACGTQPGGRRVELAAGSAEGAARGFFLLCRWRRELWRRSARASSRKSRKPGETRGTAGPGWSCGHARRCGRRQACRT